MPAAVSITAGAFADTMEEVSPVTMGVISTTWAMTMAGTENSSRRLPRGPLRERSKNTINPATTGGRPIRVWIIFRISLRPLNFPVPSNTPRGTPIHTAMAVLDRDILRVTHRICRSSQSAPNNSPRASANTSIGAFLSSSKGPENAGLMTRAPIKKRGRRVSPPAPLLLSRYFSST